MVVRLLLPTACDGGVRGGVRGRSRRGGDLCTVALRALTIAATEPGASGFATPGSYTTESGGGRTTAALATAASTAVAAAADDGWPSPPLLPAPAPQLWFSGCCRPEPRHSSPRDVCTSCLDDAPGCMIPTKPRIWQGVLRSAFLSAECRPLFRAPNLAAHLSPSTPLNAT